MVALCPCHAHMCTWVRARTHMPHQCLSACLSMQLARSKGSLIPVQVLLLAPVIAFLVKGTCLFMTCLSWLSCFFTILQCRAGLWPSLALHLRQQTGYLVNVLSQFRFVDFAQDPAWAALGSLTSPGAPFGSCD